MMIFFMSNALEGHFISTGAFEIALNGMLWELDVDLIIQGRPNKTEIVRAVKRYLSVDILAKDGDTTVAFNNMWLYCWSDVSCSNSLVNHVLQKIKTLFNYFKSP